MRSQIIREEKKDEMPAIKLIKAYSFIPGIDQDESTMIE